MQYHHILTCELPAQAFFSTFTEMSRCQCILVENGDIKQLGQPEYLHFTERDLHHTNKLLLLIKAIFFNLPFCTKMNKEVERKEKPLPSTLGRKIRGMGVEAETGHLAVDPALPCSFCYTTRGFCSPSSMQTAEGYVGWNAKGGLFGGDSSQARCHTQVS